MDLIQEIMKGEGNDSRLGDIVDKIKDAIPGSEMFEGLVLL